MSTEDLDSKQAIIGMRKELNYDDFYKEMVDFLNGEKEIILATSSNDRVTARTISFVNDGLIIYFFTWEHNKKIIQIKNNPNVALCLGAIQIEGDAEIIGQASNCMDEELYNLFVNKLSRRAVDTFANIPEMNCVKVIPSYSICRDIDEGIVIASTLPIPPVE